MNKFTQMISSNGNKTLVRRAQNIATNAEIAQKTLLNQLIQKKTTLQLRLDTTMDLAPKNSQDLIVASGDWNPETWVTEIQNIKQELYSIEIQIKLAQETYDEFFKEIA